MKGTVKIGEREIPMLANGATNIYYRQLTHKDLLSFFTKNSKQTVDDAENIDMLMPLAFVMAMQAEGKTSLSNDDYVEWLAQFEPLQVEMALDSVMNIYTANKATTSTAKKNNPR